MRINANHFAEGVRVVPTPNKSGSLKPELIIVHDTAGQLDHMTSVSWLCNPQAKASAHFVIGRKGEIIQLASCLVKTWHAGKSSYKGRQNVNDFAIGIEIANPGKLFRPQGSLTARAAFGKEYSVKDYNISFAETKSHGAGWWVPYSEAQIKATLDLCMAIGDKYGIKDVAAHFEISPGRKIDVNPLFPLAWLRAKLSGRQDDTNSVEVEIGTPLRTWPSLFPDNILYTIPDQNAFGRLITSGSFKPAGVDLPPEWIANPEQEILWHKVAVGDHSGWCLASNVRMI